MILLLNKNLVCLYHTFATVLKGQPNSKVINSQNHTLTEFISFVLDICFLATPLETGIHEMNFKINSVRKKPQLPTDDIKQRLKPFGIIPKKKKKSYKLPNLINPCDN